MNTNYPTLAKLVRMMAHEHCHDLRPMSQWVWPKGRGYSLRALEEAARQLTPEQQSVMALRWRDNGIEELIANNQRLTQLDCFLDDIITQDKGSKILDF